MGCFLFHFFAIFLLLSCSTSSGNSLFLDTIDGEQLNEVGNLQKNGCDLYNGSWVIDDSYPLYNSLECPFLGKGGFNCLYSGRPDKDYLKYRWEPSGCKAPRFDGEDFLKRYTGKKIMFVGDSLSNNQWQSFICMIHAAVPNLKYTLTSIRKGKINNVTFPKYDISIILDRNVFLVDLVVENGKRILKLDSIQGGNLWRGVDMLIFNTFHWWSHRGKLQPWDLIQEGDTIVKDMDRLVAFEKGLTTWAKWVDSNVDPTITKVFYLGIAPTHQNGEEWNEPGATCEHQTEPVNGTVYPGGPVPGVAVVKRVLGNMTKPVSLLDITALSQLRKDGHPSTYAGQKGSDCSHWCVAGVPDTWNALMYASLVLG